MAAPLKNAKGTSLVVVKKKRYVVAGGGHGSSAWKIAYADFVTAMMAFFLLMWLVNSMSHDADKGASPYFDPLGVADASSGSGGVLGGQTVTADGAMPDVAVIPPEEESLLEEDAESRAEKEPKITAEQEKKEFEEVQKQIQEALDSSPETKGLAQNMLLEITSEGLKIQIVDQFKKPMFPTGSSMLYFDAQKLLDVVAKTIKDLPQRITITGHTDRTQYGHNKTGYTNWELSADRATATRRYLVKTLDPRRIFEVSGKADAEPLLADAYAPANRRVSIVLKNLATASGQKEKTTANPFLKGDQPIHPLIEDKPPESKKPKKGPKKSL